MNLRTILATAFLGLSASVSNASVIVQWDFNSLKSNDDPNTPSCIDPAVCSTLLENTGLCQDFSATGGIDDTAYRTYTGWSESFTADPTGRKSLAPAADTLWFDVTFSKDAVGTIDCFDFCYRQLDCSSPTLAQASIYWQNDKGGIEWATTGQITLGDSFGANPDFTCQKLFFTSSSSAIPSGIDLAGKTVHVEFQAWGGSAPDASNPGALALENVTLSGNLAAVPEPGSALLIAAVGFMFVLRRNSRHALV